MVTALTSAVTSHLARPIQVVVPVRRHAVPDARDVGVEFPGARARLAGVQATSEVDDGGSAGAGEVGLGELSAATLRLILQRQIRRRRVRLMTMLTEHEAAVVRR